MWERIAFAIRVKPRGISDLGLTIISQKRLSD